MKISKSMYMCKKKKCEQEIVKKIFLSFSILERKSGEGDK